jgi:hypothetical protein
MCALPFWVGLGYGRKFQHFEKARHAHEEDMPMGRCSVWISVVTGWIPQSRFEAYMDAHLLQRSKSDSGTGKLQPYIRLFYGLMAQPQWDLLDNTTSTKRAQGALPHSGLVIHGLTCSAI